MRVACLTIPGFFLQVHARSAPHLIGTAFGLLAETEGKVPRVIACSRRARAEGVKEGMTATQARAVAKGVNLIDAEPAAYRQGMQALGEALLALSVTVDVDQLGTAWALVPPRLGGPGFAEKAIEAVRRLGFTARAGVADDRFTAWAATQATPHETLRVVPPGGSARFLAPLPLGLLPLDGDVRRTLGLLGIRTLGDFAALPPPSVGRRWSESGVDLQALARGEDRRPLCAFVPEAAIHERFELEAAVTELEPLLFLARPLLERACQRVVGRGRAAARVVITLSGERRSTEATIAPSRPTPSARLLLDLLRAHLAERTLEHPVDTLAATIVEEGELEPQELDLLDRSAPAPDAVDRAVARLRAAFGPGAAFAAKLEDRHRPEAAWSLSAFVPPMKAEGAAHPPYSPGARRPRRARRPPPPVAATPPRAGQCALRLLDPPAPADVDGDLGRGAHLRVDGRPHEVIGLSGPSRLEGEWWTDAPLGRDYYEVETDDGARYWLFRDHADGRLYLHGVFD